MGVPISSGFRINCSFVQVIFVGFMPSEKLSSPVNPVIFCFNSKDQEHQLAQFLASLMLGILG